MKAVAILLLSVYLCGCSQRVSYDVHCKGKIPLDPKRWYQLDNAGPGFYQMFDCKPDQKIYTGTGKMLDRYEAWYPLQEGEQMTIDSVLMFDFEGTNEDHPMTIYAVDDKWQRTPIAVFTGMRYGKWNGPDPSNPDVFALRTPAKDFKYLVVDSWGELPGELTFFGPYTPPKKLSQPQVAAAPLRNFFGVNAFEWDFESAPDVSILDTKKLDAIKNFTGIRHYMDWDKLEPREGQYTFNPTQNGSWNYDAIYEWCHAQGIEVLACLKTIPDWMQQTYPLDKRGNENVPMRYGKDAADPASYVEQARVAFQYAARYGSNRNVDRHLVSVSAFNTVRIGLGLVHYIECDNERDKWWKGRQAYQTGREYAANLSAFYDGNKNTLGPGVGVKNADPDMKVVIAGLAYPSTDYVRGVIDWSLQYRGRKADGSPDLPFDVINYHYYNNDADYVPDKKQATGRAPELTNAAQTAKDFVEMAHRYAGDRPVWVTETGYDLNQQSPQKAPAIGSHTPQATEADWVLRTSLLYARSGIQRVFFYELIDDNAASVGMYATSGLANADRSRRPATDYLMQTNKLFGGFTYVKTLNTEPVVDEYEQNGKTMYVILMPSEQNRTATYSLDLGMPEAHIYTPVAGAADMKLEERKTNIGRIDIRATETPVFVTGFNSANDEKRAEL